MPLFDFFKDSNSSSLETKVKNFFADPTPLSTDRLLLTKILPEHSDDMYEYSSDPDVVKYLTWSTHSSQKETERYVNLLQKKYLRGTFYDFGLIHKETGKFIGTCGFTSFDYRENSAEIGYVLAKPYWGQALAVEAARCIMEFGFENFALSSFCAKCIQGNDASMRVMQKLGMSLSGIYTNGMFIKGSYKTIIVYSVTKDDYYKKFKENL